MAEALAERHANLRVPETLRLPWSGTFHAIGNRLIRTYAQRLGLDPSKLVIVGHGCDSGAVEAISAGKAYATVEQSPFDDGAYAARAAKDLAAGKSPQAIQYLPNPAATKATLNVCYSQKK